MLRRLEALMPSWAKACTATSSKRSRCAGESPVGRPGAREALQPGDMRVYNTGTGHGASVREIIEISRSVTGHAIPAIEAPRRPGDVPKLYADSSKIQRELGWSPKYTDLREIIASAWRWHESHPQGYNDKRK